MDGGDVVVFFASFDVVPVVDRLEDLQHFGEQRFIERLLGPVGPLVDAIRIRRAGDAGREVRIGKRELQRELGNVDSATGTVLGRLPGDIVIERENFTFYFPLMTGLLISIVLSVLLWFWMRK